MPKALRKALTMSHKCLPKALSDVIKAKTHKYGAERTACLYGHMHDSKKEAMWCVKLEQLVKEGSITGLLREPHYAPLIGPPPAELGIILIFHTLKTVSKKCWMLRVLIMAHQILRLS